MSDLILHNMAGVREVLPMGIKGKTTNRSTGGAGAAATCAYTADADRGHKISQVVWSYSAAPTGGRLLIQSASDTLFDIDIAAAGHGQVTFAEPLVCGTNEAVTVTLAAPGGAIVGKLNVTVWRS